MAKFDFIKKIKKKKEVTDTQSNNEFSEKNSEKKEKNSVFSVIWDKAADAVEAVDEILEELGEIWEAGSNGLVSIGAAVINFYDKASAVVEWFILKTLVVFGRRLHDIRIKSIEYKNDIIKNSIILGSAFIVIAIAFALTTGYEYSYNGRPLGIVKEQKDVVEILELASEELSQEYGSNIVIDPEEDITFRTVVSYGKEVDTEDDVLRRLTYMGEINAQASAIVVDGQVKVIVENEKIAEQVLSLPH